MALTRFASIEFMDGKTMQFSFETTKDEEDPTMAFGLRSLMNQANLVIDLDNRIVVIPMANVRKLEITPSPERLPDGVVRSPLRGETD